MHARCHDVTMPRRLVAAAPRLHARRLWPAPATRAVTRWMRTCASQASTASCTAPRHGRTTPTRSSAKR
eukprot:308579-Chlamydomonas_euryale.AAC.1